MNDYNYCPYCGRRLADGVTSCATCGYVLGTDLGIGVLAAPRSTDPDFVYREGAFHPPAHPFGHAGQQVSAWDGRVHGLTSSDGLWRWDGHRWVPNQQAPAPMPAHAATPAPVANPSDSSPANWIVGAILFVMALFFLIYVVEPYVWGTGGPTTGGGSWYIHWTCGSSAQCAQVMGGATGARGPLASSAECDTTRNSWAANGTMQRTGTWCSTSSNPADRGP